eukprot:m51a1_g3673 putative importin alpha (546) ;mRNA; f:281546-283840
MSSTAARSSVKARVGFSTEDARRKREEQQLQIRKQKREESMLKRRNLQHLGPEDDSEAPDASKANFPELLAKINSADAEQQLVAAISFRKLLSIEHQPPIDEVVALGVVPRFVQLLTVAGNPRLQFEALWCLTNVASGSSEQTKVVIESGAVPHFISLMSLVNDDVREQAAWALGNIAGDSAVYRDYVLSAGVMQPLLQLLASTTNTSVLRNATWTLSNLCRGKPQPAFDSVRPALPTLLRLMAHSDAEVAADACWAMSYLSDGAAEKVTAIIEAGAVPQLVQLLLHPSLSVQTPALRTVGNIVTGDDSATQAVINSGALNSLATLLTNSKRGIKKEACWAISNITAGTRKQIQSVIEAQLIPVLLELMKNAEFEIKKEAAWAVSNACSGGGNDQIKYLVQSGVVAPLCELLDSNDARLVTVALEGLENILKVGAREASATSGENVHALQVEEAGGLSKIEELQTHPNQDIYDKAVRILERFFSAEEEDDPSLLPQYNPAAGGQQQFTFSAPGTAPAQFPAGGFSFGQPQQPGAGNAPAGGFHFA